MEIESLKLYHITIDEVKVVMQGRSWSLMGKYNMNTQISAFHSMQVRIAFIAVDSQSFFWGELVN